MMSCHDIEKMIEPYVDGDLEAGIRQRIEEHMQYCQDCKLKLTFAIRIRNELGTLPKHTCPDRVVQRVSGRIADERRGRFRWRKPSWISLRPRYVLGVTAGAAIIAVVLLSLNLATRIRRFTDSPPQYTQQEIAQARQDILLAFGYVHYATNRTQQVIEEDVLPRGVVRPLQKSIEHMHLLKEKGESS